MSFDLNVNNYTKDELIEMFELPPNFDANILEMKEAKLRENIFDTNEVSEDTQKKILDFLVKAKESIKTELQTANKLTGQIYHPSIPPPGPTKLSNEEHNIQEKSVKPWIFANSTRDVFPGISNPIGKGMITKNLTIDSRFRDNYYATSSTNFRFNLPTNFNNVVKMTLTSIELPTTFYDVSKQYGNNFFSITVNSQTKIIDIPEGNYSQTGMITSINNQLSLAGAPFNAVVFNLNLTLSTGSGQTLVGFSDLSGNTELELNFQTDVNGLEDHNTPLPLKFGWKLGFRNGIYTNNLNYVSEGVIDVIGSRYFFLVVDDYNNNVYNSYYSAFNSSILNKNILARISLQNTLFTNFQQNNLLSTTITREYFGPVNINSLNIQLLDEYGRVAYLNNMDFSFSINLLSVYDL